MKALIWSMRILGILFIVIAFLTDELDSIEAKNRFAILAICGVTFSVIAAILGDKYKENSNTTQSLFALRNQTVNPNQTSGFIIVDGVLEKYIGNETHVVIPNSVRIIGERAFFGSKLTSITIPNSVQKIGAGAFLMCRNLSTVEIPDSVIKIERAAFSMCSDLWSVKISGSVDTISDSTFNSCVKLETVEISNGVKKIGDSAFLMCSNLWNITIPVSVISIGENAFNGCKHLETVEIANGGTYVSPTAFLLCKNLTIYSPSGAFVEMFANAANIEFIPVGVVEDNTDSFDFENDDIELKSFMSFFEHMKWKPELLEKGDFLKIKIQVPVEDCLADVDCDHVYPLLLEGEFNLPFYKITSFIPTPTQETRAVDACYPIAEKLAKDWLKDDVEYIMRPSYVSGMMGTIIEYSFNCLPEYGGFGGMDRLFDVVQKAIGLQYFFIDFVNTMAGKQSDKKDSANT